MRPGDDVLSFLFHEADHPQQPHLPHFTSPWVWPPDFTIHHVHLTCGTPWTTQVLEPRLTLHVYSANAAPTRFCWFIASSLVSGHPQLHHIPVLISIGQMRNVCPILHEVTENVSASHFFLRTGGRETSNGPGVCMSRGDVWRLPHLRFPTEAGKDELPPFPYRSSWKSRRPSAALWAPCLLMARGVWSLLIGEGAHT